MQQQTVEDQLIDMEIPVGKIYKDRAIYFGTFLGGPLIGGYMIANNFKTFNEPGKARKTWIYTIIATLVIFGGAMLVADSAKIPNQVIPLVYTYLAYALVRHYQGAQIAAFLKAGGQFYHWGRALLVTLIGAVITVAGVFALIYLDYLRV